jgi:hypothetical protein
MPKTIKGPMRITKVKYSKSRVLVQYQVEREGSEPDEYSMECADAPHPDFEKALQALAPHAILWCELPEALVKRSRISGVSLSWNHDEDGDVVMGAVVTALVTLVRCQSPLVLNTPHKPERPYSDGDPNAVTYCLTADCIAAIGKVLEEAEAYLDGKRAQGSLPLGDAIGDTSGASFVNDPTFLARAERMCPTGKDGVTAITLSSGGKSVTLTSETRKKIRAIRKALAK